jgi:hypothetical protein
MFKKTLLAALVASSLGSVALPAFAQDYGYRNAPPPPRQEYAPPQRRGQVWVPGHWERQNRQYVWVQGFWVRERGVQHYRPAHWEERNGRWYFVQGSWARGQRDRDGDGIPNRMDRDRDNDGVPNAQDRRPNDPRRY